MYSKVQTVCTVEGLGAIAGLIWHELVQVPLDRLCHAACEHSTRLANAESCGIDWLCHGKLGAPGLLESAFDLADARQMK